MMFRFSFRKMATFGVAMLLFSIAQTTKLTGNLYKPKVYNICWSFGQGIDASRADWGFDLAEEESVGRIRLYDAAPTPPGFLQIAQERGVRVTMGAWLGSNPERNAEQLQMLRSAITGGLVEPVAIVGNEALLVKSVSVDELVEYIEQTKRDLPEYVAVTTAEVDDELIKNPKLINAMRHVVGMIYYPFAHWVPIDNALQDLIERYNQIKRLSGDKKVVIYETGWPSCGAPMGYAIPSVPNQKRYNREVADWARKNDVEVYFFQLVDEPWKAEFSDKDHDFEACWGWRNADGSPKS